ncbi:hypothetical protein P7H60_06415 [Vagococcus carniphilus]|uniref:hypothetical protein n=1 Tax=Vagococcus carniphilus TaxID=218144 RepID=UPI00288D1306|nr:hypothetical protein [Vagococcus carniphilus]MDT2848790.1 hypothetical protein [Vagococcus carniphilus]
MQRQNLSDLNGYLFEQLDRLNQDDITQQQLDTEVKRAKSINDTARNIVENAKTVLAATKAFDTTENMNADVEKPKMLN